MNETFQTIGTQEIAPVFLSSEKLDQIIPALIKVNIGIKGKVEQKGVHAQGYKYASERDMIMGIRDALAENDIMPLISVEKYDEKQLQYTKANGSAGIKFYGYTTAILRAIHSSGQWVQIKTVGGDTDENGKVSSQSLTAAKKNLYRSLLLVAAGDDDVMKNESLDTIDKISTGKVTAKPATMPATTPRVSTPAPLGNIPGGILAQPVISFSPAPEGTPLETKAITPDPLPDSDWAKENAECKAEAAAIKKLRNKVAPKIVPTVEVEEVKAETIATQATEISKIAEEKLGDLGTVTSPNMASDSELDIRIEKAKVAIAKDPTNLGKLQGIILAKVDLSEAQKSRAVNALNEHMKKIIKDNKK